MSSTKDTKDTKDSKDTKEVEPPVEELIEVSATGQDGGVIVSIDGNEFTLNAQEVVALKFAIDQAVVGLSL